MNEVYDKETGVYEIVDVEFPEDWIVYDEIDQQSIIAFPSYSQTEILTVKEEIVKRLPLGGEVYNVETIGKGIKICYYDHMADYGFDKSFLIETKIPVYEFNELVGWNKPLGGVA